jgi:hypothetical protein
MRKATITLMPDSSTKADIQTGGLTNLEILDMLQSIQSHFAKELIKEYQEITGVEDVRIKPEKLGEYMNHMRQIQKLKRDDQ